MENRVKSNIVVININGEPVFPEVPKLDKQVKSKWISALRGGHFKQGTGQLYSDITEETCCLGVLACILNPNDLDRLSGEEFVYNTNKMHDLEYPSQLKFKSGLDIDTNRLLNYLSVCNDTTEDSEEMLTISDKIFTVKHKSFNEIADYVEKYL